MKMQSENPKTRFLSGLTYHLYNLIEWLRETKTAIKLATSISLIKKSRDPAVRNYCAYNRVIFNNSSKRTDRIILLDCSPIPQWVIANSFFLNKLSKKLDASIVSYGIFRRDPYVDGLYRSFGCNKHLFVKSNSAIAKERKRLFQLILASVKTKDELFKLKINEVWIGLDIYESILRTGVPTVEVASFRSRYQIFLALKYYLYFSELFSSGSVQSVVLSHDNYISMGLVAKIAYRYKIPVFLTNPLEIVKTVRTHHLYERFERFPEFFTSLTETEKNEAISWSKEKLQLRLKGVVGVNMSYQIKSAFTPKRIDRQTRQSDNIKVVVATHCFFDNPHGLGWMLFTDFYEWICYLGELSKETDYEWYLKPHADYLPGTLETLTRITEMYPKLRLIDPGATWHQLKEEGVSVVLTCYGSIGHELPLLGYKVVNAAYNPHIAYRFNWHPKTIKEYRNILLNLPSWGEVLDVERIYEFFYVSKAMSQPDDFLFESYERYLADAGGNPLNLSTYAVFLSQRDSFRRKADEKMDIFLDLDKTYSCEP